MKISENPLKSSAEGGSRTPTGVTPQDPEDYVNTLLLGYYNSLLTNC